MTAAIEVASKAAIKIVVNAVSGGSSGGGGGVTAHGDLTGLTTGDDHPQYQRSESTFTTASSFTITDETTVVSTGSTVVLPDAQANSGRTILVGAGADVTVTRAGTDVFLDGVGSTTFLVRSGNGVGFTSVNAGGTWGWAIVTRQGSSYDLPVWAGQSLAAGKVLRIDGTGAPAWADLAAGDLPAATTSAAGSMSAADKTKLDGVATGATANATDAQLRDRSTHTGTQAVGTITGLAAIATSGSAADLSGTVATARLGTGTADATTFLRGDQTYAVPAGKASVVTALGAGSGVSGSTSPTSLLASTVTLPACAAGDVLLVTGGISLLQNSTAGRVLTLALKLGATTVCSAAASSVPASGTTRSAMFWATVRVGSGTSESASLTFQPHAVTSGTSNGVATETISSGTLALDVLISSATATATQTYTLDFLTITKVAA